MENHEELLVHEMSDIMFAEGQLVKALGKLATESSNPQMKKAFKQHQKETKGHINRLKMAFEAFGTKPEKIKCEGILGLIREKQSISKERPTDEILDAFNRGAAMKAEHYEISAYESMIELSDKLGLTDVSQLLSQNLAEEMNALETLRRIEA